MSVIGARAFWVAAPGRGEIRACDLTPPVQGEVLVRTLYTGISRGTEALVFAGRVPPSQYGAMRAPFQEGEFPAPVKYGYLNVGVVEEGPGELAGRTVFCLFPHQTRYVVPADRVVPLPPEVPPERAVLAGNLETALNGLWDAAVRPGDRVAVVGAGAVGALAAWLAGGMPGCDVRLIDTDPAKAAIAERLGVAFSDTAGCGAGWADVVIHASGHPDGLVTALRLAGFEATVLELSWFGDQPVLLPLGEDYHAKRLILRSSQVGTVSQAQRARWDHRRRLALALSLLTEPALDIMIGAECRFEQLPEVMAGPCREANGALCWRVVY